MSSPSAHSLTPLRRLSPWLLVATLGACGGEPRPPTPTGEGSLPPRPDTASCDFGGQPPSVVQEVALHDAGSTSPEDVVAAAPFGDQLVALTGDGRLWRVGTSTPQPVLEPTVAIDRALALATSSQHPDHVVIAYRTPSGVVVVSRWTRSGDGLDAATENVIFTNPFSAPETAGAALAFDDDGLLFAAFGDDGSTPAESTAAQDPTTLAGSVVRVDISDLDAGGIAIPTDNPTPADFGSAGNLPTRTWAIGVRHPTGAFVDATGRLWLADQGLAVGEIHAVPEVRDLGWPRYDGFVCNEPAGCGVELDKLPQSVVDTTDACPLLLGTTSTFPAWPSLEGMLFVGETCTGAVHAIKTNAPDGWLRRERVAEHPGLSALARAPEGEAIAFGADVARIEALHEGAFFPTSLSGSGCFDDDMTPRPGVIPFDVSSPLWSDGSIKRRYFELPPDATIDVAADGSWTFPLGSVVIKRFGYVFDGTERDVETRVMVLRNYGWEMHSYRWDDPEDDAVLLNEADIRTMSTVGPDGEPLLLDHVFPSRHSCIVCHGTDRARVLALRSDQLNREVTYDDGKADQLAAMAAIGLFDGAPPSMATIASPADPSAPIADRARAYLDANCSHCHRPGGWVSEGVDMDLRYATPFEDTRTCSVKTVSGESGDRLAPGSAEDSRIYQRMATRDAWQMPPLATTIVDPAGLAVVRKWIDGLSGCP